MKKVYIVAAKRTAVGSFLGALKGVHASELGAPLVKNILETTKINPSKIDEVIVGNILPAGLGQNISRQVSIKGGVPVEVPAYSINMACGSAMKAIMNATTAIQAGYANLILAGGVESMSRAPMLLPETVRGGMKMGEIKVKDHMIYDALTDVFNNVHMGVTAENIATKHAITREEQDEFSLKSQQKAIAAVDAGRFDDEVVPLEIKAGKEVIIFNRDEYPNRTTNLEKLAKLRPAFKPEGGVVTAGNASGINDGGSMVLVAMLAPLLVISRPLPSTKALMSTLTPGSTFYLKLAPLILRRSPKRLTMRLPLKLFPRSKALMLSIRRLSRLRLPAMLLPMCS